MIVQQRSDGTGRFLREKNNHIHSNISFLLGCSGDPTWMLIPAGYLLRGVPSPNEYDPTRARRPQIERPHCNTHQRPYYSVFSIKPPFIGISIPNMICGHYLLFNTSNGNVSFWWPLPSTSRPGNINKPGRRTWSSQMCLGSPWVARYFYFTVYT